MAQWSLQSASCGVDTARVRHVEKVRLLPGLTILLSVTLVACSSTTSGSPPRTDTTAAKELAADPLVRALPPGATRLAPLSITAPTWDSTSKSWTLGHVVSDFHSTQSLSEVIAYYQDLATSLHAMNGEPNSGQVNSWFRPMVNGDEITYGLGAGYSTILKRSGPNTYELWGEVHVGSRT